LSKIRCVYLHTGVYLKEKTLEEKILNKFDSNKWDVLRRNWVSYVKSIKDKIENKVDPMTQLTQLEGQIRAFVRSLYKR